MLSVCMCACVWCLGSRLIILHAGSETGWVPNCALMCSNPERVQVFESVFRNCSLHYAYYVGDYHDEMTANRFEHWWSEQLLPSIPHKVSLLWIMLLIIAAEANHILLRVGQRRKWWNGSK